MAVDAITATGSLVLDPLRSLWFSFVDIIPGIVAAIVIIIIGYFIALGLGHLVRVILQKAGLDNYLVKAHMTKRVGHTKISNVLGEIVKWYVFIVFLQQAVSLLNLGTLSSLLEKFVLWLPNVIVAALIIIFGMMFIHYVGIKIEEHTKLGGVKLLNAILKVVLAVLVAIIALKQIGVSVSVVENSFLIIIGGFALGIAIALGIALGKGLGPESKSIVREIKGIIKH